MKKLTKVILLLMSLLCMCMGFTMTSSAKSSKTATGTYRYDYAFDELTYLNKTRTKAGKKKVKMDQALTDIAMTRAAELSIKYSHTRPNGKPWYSAGNATQAENIAYGYTTVKKVDKAWTDSKDHYKTRTSSKYTGVGIGCFKASDGTLYWVEEFGTYKSAAKKKSNSSTGSASGIKVTLNSVDNTASGVKLKWDRVYGVTGYYVYRKTSGGSYKKIKTVTKASKTTYTDKTAKNNKKYTYKVVPYTKKDGKKGTGTTLSVLRLPQPSSVSVKDLGYGEAKVSWKKVSGAKGYRIEWDTSSSFKTYKAVTVDGSGTTSRTITGLKSGTTYYFRVYAYGTCSNKTCMSAASKKTSVKTSTKTVAVPTIVSVKSDATGKATVTWKKASGATGYEINYGTNKDFSGISYANTVSGGDKTSYTITGLDSGKTYYVRVMTLMKNGTGTHESKYSDVLSVKVK